MHATNRSRTSMGQRGSAILVGIFALMVVGLVAGGVTAVLTQRRHTQKLLIERTKATEVAEGGAARVLAVLAAQPDTVTEPPADKLTGQILEGSYQAEVTQVGGNVFGVVSTGTVRETSATVKVYLDVPSAYFALDKGIFANGSIDASGNGTLHNGSHSNQSTIYMGNCEVFGDVDSVGTSTTQGSADVQGTVRSGVQRVDFPRLDLDHYYNIASDNGQVLVGDQTLKGTYNPPGGVMWVVGNVRIKATTTITGMLVATGDIEQVGRCVQTQVGANPALATRDGNIWLRGNGTFQGMIYADTGWVDVSGATDLTGCIVAWGDVRTRGNWGVLDFAEQNPELSGEDQLSVVAWER